MPGSVVSTSLYGNKIPPLLQRSQIYDIDPNVWMVQRIGTESLSSTNLGKTESTSSETYKAPSEIAPYLVHNLLGYTVVVEGPRSTEPAVPAPNKTKVKVYPQGGPPPRVPVPGASALTDRPGIRPQMPAAPDGRTMLRKLWRNPPCGHPLYPWLYAQRMHSIRGIGPVAKAGQPFSAYTPATAAESVLKFAAAYREIEFVVDFAPLPHKVFEGYTSSVEDEMSRYVWVDRDPSVSQIAVEGRNFFWTESPVEGGPSKNTKKDLPASWHVFEVRGSINVHWYEVPREFVFRPEGVAPRFEEGLGKCNRYHFLGYPRGTLLLDAVVHGDPRPMAGIACKDDAYIQPYLFHDIKFVFKFHDPPRGDFGNPWPPLPLVNTDTFFDPTADNGIRGHQLLPHRTDDSALSGKYYLATHNGKSPDLLDPLKRGRMLYEEYDFRKMFDFYGNLPGEGN